MAVSEYNREQLNTLTAIRFALKKQLSSRKPLLLNMIKPYLEFRTKVDDFHKNSLADICNEKCFQKMQNACCNREGIATFFADHVINIMNSNESEMDEIEFMLHRETRSNKCSYLTENGCSWRCKPIVCEMFLCTHGKKILALKGKTFESAWRLLRQEEKSFTWPDRPVLFDDIERLFLNADVESPLMYFHKSPGLMRIKSGWENR